MREGKKKGEERRRNRGEKKRREWSRRERKGKGRKRKGDNERIRKKREEEEKTLRKEMHSGDAIFFLVLFSFPSLISISSHYLSFSHSPFL